MIYLFLTTPFEFLRSYESPTKTDKRNKKNSVLVVTAPVIKPFTLKHCLKTPASKRLPPPPPNLKHSKTYSRAPNKTLSQPLNPEPLGPTTPTMTPSPCNRTR